MEIVVNNCEYWHMEMLVYELTNMIKINTNIFMFIFLSAHSSKYSHVTSEKSEQSETVCAALKVQVKAAAVVTNSQLISTSSGGIGSLHQKNMTQITVPVNVKLRLCNSMLILTLCNSVPQQTLAAHQGK